MDVGQTYIVNDPLDNEDVHTTSALDRFKNAVLRRWMRGDNVLVDFGSSSGKFLQQNKAGFRSVIGVEVTRDAASFARKALGLDIRDTVEDLPDGIDVVTCWHSLEHVPAGALHAIVTGISRRLSARGRVIISVPNADSLQHRIFGRRYAFYDVPNHHHQFSIRSLDMLMASVGLPRVQLAYSGMYNLFGWLQGGVNAVAGGHNYLYYRLKRRSGAGNPLRTAAHLVLLPLVALPALALALLEAVSSERQGVITACYARRDS